MDQPPLEKELKPRPYQIYLYEKAVKQNSILYLPTGSGKTYIAVLLIKKLSAAVKKPYKLGGKRTIFIVNTVALVGQQCQFLARHTGLKCKGYTGDMQVDFWTDEIWNKEIEEHELLIMTAQIFLNLLLHGIMSLNKVNLIIFDECHRAVKDHPMRQIMQRFDGLSEGQPRILAMSASLLNGNVKQVKIDLILKELEITFQSTINTVDSLSFVYKYSTNPIEKIEYYTSPQNLSIFSEIQEIISNALTLLEYIEIPEKWNNSESSVVFRSTSKNVKLKRILNDIVEHLNEMYLYGGSYAVLLHMIQLEYIKKFADDPHLIAILDYITTQLMKVQKLLNNEMEDVATEDTIYRYSSPKILKLIEILRKFNENLKNNQKFCCIIFVKRRFTTKILYHLLNKLSSCDPNFKFLKADFIVGYNNDPYKNARETLCIREWNKDVLTRFRNGTVNCLIATDVIDEGIDVPLCTLVVRYYIPMDFRAYLQSKGRARHSSSHYVMLACLEDKFEERYKLFKETEKRLKLVLHGKTDDRLTPTEKEIEEVLYSSNIEPYRVKNKNGNISVITEQNAVSLISRYCANLISSKFITLAPTWIKEDLPAEKKWRVHLTLPPISNLTETIIGDPMDSIDVAKRSAALKACIRLHKIGELNDNLLPLKPEDVLENTNYLFPYMEKEEIDTNAIPGTYAKKRRHQRIYPQALYAAYPQENTELYLHIIDMKPTYPKPINDNRHLVFHNLLSSNNSYGILSTKRMSEIPSFPIFMNVGDLSVSMKINKSIKPLMHNEIQSLKNFHSLIFNEILAVIKNFTIFDIENKENCFLVVPINENQQINWDVVNRYKTITSIPPTKPLEVKNYDYELALVTPNYRASNVYIVTEICEYLRAESRFATADYDSYVHYFRQRHDCNIENTKQPMLEVKPISKNINCIKPRVMKAGISKRKLANINEDFEEHLVPELCERIDFPAVYWLKATTLPSILHRLCELLVANDLRVEIAQEAQLDLSTLQPDHKWEPLEMKLEVEQISSENIESTFDDGYSEDIDNIPIESTPIEIDVLSTEKNFYSWTKDQEPPDLERCADRIQQIDIEYYYQFMANVTPEDKNNISYQNAIKSIYLSAPKVSAPRLKILEAANTRGPSPVDILKSLTSKISNDAFNFEREETLGDSFLKFAVSLYLYQSFPTYGEGQLTFLKGRLVGNLNLFYCGKQKNIPGIMNIEDFSPMRNFVTPAYTVERNLQKLILDSKVSVDILYDINLSAEERINSFISSNTNKSIKEKLASWPHDLLVQSRIDHFLGMQVVSDKTVADCVEALIGVYLLHLGIKGALSILKWFEILPKTLSQKEYLYSKVPDPKLGSGDVNELMPWADMIEEKLGYKFRERGFLLQAFTHPSFTCNTITSSYQRLEFLGDAVLDLLLTFYIYETCGNLNPGELTDLRSALVNNITFACLAVRHGLHIALLAYAPELFTLIDKFVKFQESRNHEINDELLWILLEEEECNIAEHVDVPKILGDIFESIIGAIFLDSEKDLQKTWQIIYSLMKNEIDLFSKNVPKQPVRIIYERQGANPKFSAPQVVEQNKAIMVTLSVIINGKRKFFHGFGSTKKLAKRAASKLALKHLIVGTK